MLADMARAPVVAVRIDGVGGQGLTLGALFFRSKVRMNFSGVLPYNEASNEAPRRHGRAGRHADLTQIIRPDLVKH